MSNVKDRYQLRVVKHVLGPALNKKALWILVGLLILIELVVSPIFSLVDETAKRIEILSESETLRYMLEFGIAIFIVFIVYAFAKKNYESTKEKLPLFIQNKVFDEHSNVLSSSSISLFITLSNQGFYRPQKTEKEIIWDVDLTLFPRLDDFEFVEKWDRTEFKEHNWRQPLICINHFLIKKRQTDIYISCSSKSLSELDKFIGVTKKLYTGNLLNIYPISGLLTEKKQKVINTQGIDFNNLREIADCLDEAVRTLEKKDSDTEIILDVTSGTKLVSVASAIVSFAQERNFIYTTNAGDIKAGFAQYGYDDEQ